MNALVRPQVVVSNGQVTTTSNAVVEYFHKQHKHGRNFALMLDLTKVRRAD